MGKKKLGNFLAISAIPFSLCLMFLVTIIEDARSARKILGSTTIWQNGKMSEINLSYFTIGKDFNSDGKLDTTTFACATRRGATVHSYQPFKNQQEIYTNVLKNGKNVHGFFEVWKERLKTKR